jgi:hypothetical protein
MTTTSSPMNGGRHDNMIDGSTHAALRDDVARAVV